MQVSCPPCGEERARRFWVDGIGMSEVEKPPALRDRGGAWFRAYDDRGAVAAEVHVGVELDFAPARRAHPALLLDDERALDDVVARLSDLGHRVDHAERETFPGHVRAHVADGHGNRVELLAPRTGEPGSSDPP